MIVASNLTKRFSIATGVKTAVNSLSFTVQPGEVYGLLGPNGAGKTTTLRMVMGLLQPDEGEVLIDGIRSDSASQSVLSKLGMISTNDGVYPWLSVREMLVYFADLYGVPLRDAQKRLVELAGLLGIETFLDQRCSTLSTGQRQRVILARGLMHDPPVMLLDEPTRGLDIVGSRTTFEYIDLLRSQGKAVLLSTHRLDEAERLCDRFGLLHCGALRYEGSLSQLQSQTGREHLVDMFLELLDQRSARSEMDASRKAMSDSLEGLD
ncbi:MAG: ATP-binding cassette domain-containing protein [Pirellulaceae bacterium]|nr:ATP-binding cassette domain-containing protein [Pirellulaceae bacterium]